MRSSSVRVAAMAVTRRCALLAAAVLPSGCDEAGPGSEALATLQEEVASRAEAASSAGPSVSRCSASRLRISEGWAPSWSRRLPSPPG